MRRGTQGHAALRWRKVARMHDKGHASPRGRPEERHMASEGLASGGPMG